MSKVDLDGLIADYDKQRDAFLKTMKKNFGGYVAELIKDDVVAIRWTQYSPHFNDGDPCVFSVYEADVKFKDTEEDAGDHEDGFENEYSREGKSKTFDKINAVIQKIPTEAMLDMFGDGIQVTVTADGIETEEYEHD